MPWAPDYLTTAQFKAYARIGDAADDTEIGAAISMASRAVDRQCGRQFGAVAAPEAREYTLRFSRARGGVWTAEVDDYQDLTGLALAWDSAGDGTFSTAVPAGAVVPWPRNAVKLGLAYERIMLRPALLGFTPDNRPAGLRATALWGWISVPAAVPGAVKLQVNRMHARRDAPFGVAGSPEQGSEVRLLAKLDPDVKVALERYARRAWAR